MDKASQARDCGFEPHLGWVEMCWAKRLIQTCLLLIILNLGYNSSYKIAQAKINSAG